MTFIPPVVVTGERVSEIRETSNGEGSARRSSSLRRVAENTSNGPQKSRTSISLKRTMPTWFLFIFFLLIYKRPTGSSAGAAFFFSTLKAPFLASKWRY
jgi:hypothetical protein